MSTNDTLCELNDDAEAHMGYSRIRKCFVKVRLEDGRDVNRGNAAAFVFICCLCKELVEGSSFCVLWRTLSGARANLCLSNAAASSRICSTECSGLSSDKCENLQDLVSIPISATIMEVVQTFSGVVQIAFPEARFAATLMVLARGTADTLCIGVNCAVFPAD